MAEHALRNVCIILASCCSLTLLDLMVSSWGSMAHTHPSTGSRRKLEEDRPSSEPQVSSDGQGNNKITVADVTVPIRSHWRPVSFQVPEDFEQDYDPRCDTSHPDFEFDNIPRLKGHIQMNQVASSIGLLKVLWLIFKLLLPILIPPQLPVSSLREWRLHGKGEKWKPPHLRKWGSALENDEGAPVELGQEAHYYCGRVLGTDIIEGSDGQCGPNDGPQCPSCVRFQASQVDPQNSDQDIYGGESLPFFDPRDVHKSAGLHEIIPVSPHFKIDKMRWYFQIKLQEPASNIFFTLPWSNRTQIAIFCGQLVQGLVELARTFFWRSPGFKKFYTMDWFLLTFRAELFLPVLYNISRVGVLQYQVIQLTGSSAYGPLGFYMWVPSGILLLVLLPTVWPFMPALVAWGGCMIMHICIIEYLDDKIPWNKLHKWLYVIFMRIQFYVIIPIGIGFALAMSALSKIVCKHSKQVYLCSFSRLDVFADTPESMSTFMLVLCGIALLVIMMAAFAAAWKCLPQVASPELMFKCWLNVDHTEDFCNNFDVPSYQTQVDRMNERVRDDYSVLSQG